jgi:hypothetical protein
MDVINLVINLMSQCPAKYTGIVAGTCHIISIT